MISYFRWLQQNTKPNPDSIPSRIVKWYLDDLRAYGEKTYSDYLRLIAESDGMERRLHALKEK